MRQERRLQAWWGIAVLVGTVWACETTRNPGGIQRDLTPPSIVLSNTVGDTQDIAAGLQFGVAALDNLSLLRIRLIYSGGYLAQEETTFVGQVTNVNLAKRVTFPANSGAGGNIRIVGRATDGAGNFNEDTLFIFLANVQALRVTLIQPVVGAVASSGRYIPIQVEAVQNAGVQRVGWLVSPAAQVAQAADSIVTAPSPPFPDSVVFVDSVLVTGTTGTFTIVGFAWDSAGRQGTSNQVTVSILSAANDVTAPQVEHFVAARAEIYDTITVHATDPSGIAKIGFTVRNLAGGVIGGDSVTLGGTTTDVTRKFILGLSALATFPTQVVVQGFAVDGATAANRGVSGASFLVPSPTGPARADTIVIVAGVTRPLPAGGKIADAIFNANLNELYLTNPLLSRVEIFQVANTAFVATGIPTAGPQPWGIALWPRDTLGNYGDTIVVANSGGTQLSIIDVRAGVRRLQWRQDLPNFLIETYKVTQFQGGTQEVITVHDVSDRPQYVATVCRAAGGTACATDSIFALYSTTPTQSSNSPFAGKATLRMEKLINTTNPALLFGKFFWEIGATAANTTTDTLRIELIRGNTSQIVLSACAGVNVRLESFGLGDSTYARNSGNFTHAFFGEGGNITVAFARVMAYDARRLLSQGPTTFNNSCVGLGGRTTLAQGEDHVDFGMSPGVHVSDFISNTGIKVTAVATNFNGLTNVVRADSIYYLDANLRLKATSCTLGTTSTACQIGAPGMDMNYFHDFAPSGSCTPTCGGTSAPPPDNRVLFAARPDGNIDVFDTYFGALIGSIPLRDAITGPLRVARDATGQLLFGITNRGLVMIRLPPFPNPFPAPPSP